VQTAINLVVVTLCHRKSRWMVPAANHHARGCYPELQY